MRRWFKVVGATLEPKRFYFLPVSFLFSSGKRDPLDRYLPKPFSQESDEALKKELRAMGTIKSLGLLLLRATGMRLGELGDLELDCLQALPENQWAIRVPLGKLHSDRVIPVDGEAAKIVEEMRRLRGIHPPIPHPDTGKPTHFLLLLSDGRRLGLKGVGQTLRQVAERAKLKERAWPHRLRHLRDRDAPLWHESPRPDEDLGPPDHRHDAHVLPGDPKRCPERLLVSGK